MIFREECLSGVLGLSFVKIAGNASAVAKITMTSSKVALPGLTNSRTSNMSEEQARAQFPKKGNPFHIVTNWTPQMLDLIEIDVPEPIETTNDFTRSKQRAARYWSTEVTFRYTDPETNKEYSSGIIKMTDCDIPRIDNQSYGVDYFYATCNRAIGEAIVKAAGKKNIAATVDDEKAVSNENQWWKTINKAKGRIGVLDGTGNFNPKDLHGIMLKTEAGIKGAIDISVKLKFGSKDGSNKKPSSQFRLVFDLSRGFIRKLRNDVAPPPLETSVETAPVSKKDIANDDLLQELDALEI
jgi:hypothetical protein